MTLAIDSKKAKEIEQFITASTIAKPTPALKYNNFQWKYKGKELKDVYNTIGEEKYSCDTIFLVDIDLLRYNFQNRRIQIYLKELAELKKTNRAEFKSPIVSETNEEDRLWVEDLLLGKRDIMGVKSNAAGFEQELITSGQQEPAVITVDGTLRNGNRRKAIFHEIIRKIKAREAGYSKLSPESFQYLKVVVLPKDINEEELFDLENFLQTKKDWKQPYDSITILNIIKEAYDVFHYSFEDIRDKYLHDRDVSAIELDYKKIIAIDKYLASIEKAGQYRLVDRQQEMFEDFAKTDFTNAGLANLHREKTAERQAISRQRTQTFFDMVSVNACNSEVLKPSEKAVRRIVTEIFKNGSSNPQAVLSKFYAGVDKKNLSACEETAVEKFAANIESQIDSFHGINESKAPLDKLKRIARDLGTFSPKAREFLAHKKETGKYIKLAKDSIDTLESDIAKLQKKD